MRIDLVPINQSKAGGDLALSWALDMWGDHIPHYSHQDWIDFYQNAHTADYQHWNGTDQELVYIGMRDEEIVGTISLVDFDELEEFRHLSPWIAAFIVNPKMRGEGIGSQMLVLLEEKARALGIRSLHLWTEDQCSFYLKRGYSVTASGNFEHLSLDVMQKKIQSHST